MDERGQQGGCGSAAAPRRRGKAPLAVYHPPKDLAEMSDEEIHAFAAAVIADARRTLQQRRQ